MNLNNKINVFSQKADFSVVDLGRNYAQKMQEINYKSRQYQADANPYGEPMLLKCSKAPVLYKDDIPVHNPPKI